MKKYVIMFMMMLIMLTGCYSGKAFKPAGVDVYNPKALTEYVYDFSKDEKPQKLIPIFLDANFEECTANEARYLAFDGKEFSKIKHLQKIAKYYKDQVGEHVVLINNYIKIANSEREYTKLENQKLIKYRELWIQSEEAYRQEKWWHKIDNWVNRISSCIMGAGLVYVVVIAL